MSAPAFPDPWRISASHPGGETGYRRRTPMGGACRPTVVEARSVGTTGTVFAGACLGCGWMSPTRHDGWGSGGQNPAAEDAHDHVFPGWRRLPVLTRLDPADPARAKVIARQLWRHYPPGWPDAAAPTLVAARSRFDRHGPGAGLYGGYLMFLPQAPAPVRESSEPVPLF